MARQMRRDPGTIRELWQSVQLAWRLMLDRRVSPLLKVIPLFAATYLFVPTDLFPDLFPVVGQVDDLAVILIALRLFVKLAPSEIVTRYQRELRAGSTPPEDNVIDGEWRNLDSDPWK